MGATFLLKIKGFVVIPEQGGDTVYSNVNVEMLTTDIYDLLGAQLSSIPANNSVTLTVSASDVDVKYIA